MHNMKLKVVLNQIKKHSTSNFLNDEEYDIFWDQDEDVKFEFVKD